MRDSNYFADASKDANERFYNADGFYSELGTEYNEESFPAEGNANNGGVNSMNGRTPTSQPYVIKVENTGDVAIANVKVLGKYKNLIDVTNFNNPTAIQITSGVPNVTYSQMLQQFADQPFVSGLTYIQSSNANQVLELVTIRHQDANGNLTDYTMIPRLDPYQEQSGVIPVGFNYRVNGYTEFTVASVAANTVVTIDLYPRDKVDPSMLTVGRSQKRMYSNPDIVRAQPISVTPNELGY